MDAAFDDIDWQDWVPGFATWNAVKEANAACAHLW
jgi:hypothetical protein